MNLSFLNPTTGKTEALQFEDYKLFAAVVAGAYSFHSQAALHILAGLRANRDFEPTREPGESIDDAYARRACEQADALVTQLQRRASDHLKETAT